MIIKVGKRFINLLSIAYTSELNENGITIHFIGQIDKLRITDPKEMEDLIKALKELSE
jgi:hypothetical protein